MKFIASKQLLLSFIQFTPLLLLAGMESVTVTLDASPSSIVASVISDDRNDTSFGSLVHLNRIEEKYIGERMLISIIIVEILTEPTQVKFMSVKVYRHHLQNKNRLKNMVHNVNIYVAVSSDFKIHYL